jgi:nucleotide-binding universal stress UspA family protein
MSFRDLLVVVDDSPGAAERVGVAARLASAFRAHLTGLHVVDSPAMRPTVLAQFPSEVLDVLKAVGQEDAAKARALFEAQARRVESALDVEWRTVEGDTADVVSLHARYADLTVLGQVDPEAYAVAQDLPERVVMGAGRPVIIVPYAGTFKAVGQRVVVAWNASREATRAVNDALPILERAASVRVVSVNPRRGMAGHGPIAGADISLHLARHGVPVEATTVNTDDVRVDDMLLSQAADAGADLIVMGAYGHSRLGEYVLGGATRHLLRQITVPVFMSH